MFITSESCKMEYQNTFCQNVFSIFQKANKLRFTSPWTMLPVVRRYSQRFDFVSVMRVGCFSKPFVICKQYQITTCLRAHYDTHRRGCGHKHSFMCYRVETSRNSRKPFYQLILNKIFL